MEQPWAASLTFSAATESHVGAQIHGKVAREGYSIKDLHHGLRVATDAGCDARVVDLSSACGVPRPGGVLVIKDACRLLFDVDVKALEQEYEHNIWPHLDRHLVHYKRVDNKHARGNAELGPVDIASTYKDFLECKKLPQGAQVTGRVIAFEAGAPTRSFVQGLGESAGPEGEGPAGRSQSLRAQLPEGRPARHRTEACLSADRNRLSRRQREARCGLRGHRKPKQGATLPSVQGGHANWGASDHHS